MPESSIFPLIHLFRSTLPIACILTFFSLSSCSTSRYTVDGVANISNLWDSLAMETSHHTGISVYDVSKNKLLFQSNSDQYFTPASNMKLWTLYAALQVFDSHVPAAYYKEQADSILIWGAADPGTFYPQHHDTTSLIRFLKQSSKKIVFSNAHFQTTRYGKGWAWDDFPYRFQAERTAYPLYGNKLWIDRRHDTITITPAYFGFMVQSRKDTMEQLTRNEAGTQYVYRYDQRMPYAKASQPVALYPHDITQIWSAVSGKKIVMKELPFSPGVSIEGTSIDTLAKYMIRDSDNFIAEQLLLAGALKISGKLDEDQIIHDMLQGPLRDMPDSILWVDGSGLSRYNQVTPRSVIWVLQKIIEKKGVDYVKEVFAAGGKTGTIKGWITAPDGAPFIFAKSGTHRNTFNLSGLLITRSGSLILFSWMNNHFINRQDVERNMKTFLKKLYFHY